MQKIVYSSSFLQFIKSSDCKIASILYRLYSKRYSPLMLTNEHVNYLTFRTDGTISFLPNGKGHVVNEDTGEWKRDNRQNGKPGKVIRKLFAERVQKLFKDSDFECFTNQYKANFNDDGYKFDLLGNTDIADIYEATRKPGEGSLNNSCMNGDSEYLDIYTNCDQLKILVLRNQKGELCGRALIWTIDENITIMDRIYISDDFMYDKFLSYCDDKKWWRKKHYKTYDYKDIFITPAGEEVEKTFKIYTDTDQSQFPYTDTFQYGEDGLISNYNGYQYTYNRLQRHQRRTIRQASTRLHYPAGA